MSAQAVISWVESLLPAWEKQVEIDKTEEVECSVSSMQVVAILMIALRHANEDDICPTDDSEISL